ncbi:hypothetical protein H2132_005535 [Escherichia coli]|nr:hypothetical protein [Escherichia coli]EFT2254323.1 hypothetical protein [Escherichia coli]
MIQTRNQYLQFMLVMLAAWGISWGARFVMEQAVLLYGSGKNYLFMPCSSTTKRPKIMRPAPGWSRRRISLLSERQNDVGLAGFSYGGNHVVSQNI